MSIVRVLGSHPLIRPKAMWTQRELLRDNTQIRSEITSDKAALAKYLCSLVDSLDRSTGRVLEVGVGRGLNLHAISAENPNLNVFGIDICATALDVAAAQFPELDSRNLYHQSADQPYPFDVDCFDVVFTDACLLYLPPWKVKHAVQQCVRVSASYVVFIELGIHGFPVTSLPSKDGWLHDYMRLLNQAKSDLHVAYKRLPSDFRPGGRWPTRGYCAVACSSTSGLNCI